MSKIEKRKQFQLHGLSLEDRFWAYVDKSGDCWEWTGYRDTNGYGRLNVKNRPLLAHRLSWEFSRGKITPKEYVCHRCDNPRCVNPDHLFIGDQQDNMDDKMAKGRHNYGVSLGEKHGCAKLNSDQVLAIRAATGTISEIARRFGMSRTQTRDIRMMRVWRHL
jgi:hypothetical protein